MLKCVLLITSNYTNKFAQKHGVLSSQKTWWIWRHWDLTLWIPVNLPKTNPQVFGQIIWNHLCLYQIRAGWWFQLLWRILVTWDDASQYMEKSKAMFQSPPTSQSYTSPKLVVQKATDSLRGGLDAAIRVRHVTDRAESKIQLKKSHDERST